MVIEKQSRKNTTERDGWMEGSDEVMFVGYSTLRLLKGDFLSLEISGVVLFLIVLIFLKSFLYCNLFSL